MEDWVEKCNYFGYKVIYMFYILGGFVVWTNFVKNLSYKQINWPIYLKFKN